MWIPRHNQPGDARLSVGAIFAGILLTLWIALPGVCWAASTTSTTGRHPHTAIPGKHVAGQKGLLGLPRHARSSHLTRIKDPKDATAKTKLLASLPTRRSVETPMHQPKTLGLTPLSGTGFPTRTPQVGAIRPPPKPGATIGGSSFNTHR